MSAPLLLSFPHQPDLATTMDIQIPALAWQAEGGSFTRTFYLGAAPIGVTASEDDHALRFETDHDLDPDQRRLLHERLRGLFPRQVASLNMKGHPALDALHQHYQGTIIMRTDPFEALVLTILSQNRTGEIVRAVYPALQARCGGTTPARLAALAETELTELIRSAGPYKAPRLADTVRAIARDPAAFDVAVTQNPTEQAVAYLTGFAGVAHKTAACVLVFAAETSATLPVDTHLFRVTHRLGLATHDGKLTPAVREGIIGDLLSHGPDLAPAHFLFLLVGRSTCTARAPDCPNCFLRAECPTAKATESGQP